MKYSCVVKAWKSRSEAGYGIQGDVAIVWGWWLLYRNRIVTP